MKKGALKARIGELNSTVMRLGEQVRTWKTMFVDTSAELSRLKVEIEALTGGKPHVDDQLHRIRLLEQDMAELEGEFDPPPAFAKGRQCGTNVLAALAGQPSMTVTATNEQDAPLASAATQAVNFALRDKPSSRAEKEDLYRDGLACGLSSEAAWERAKIGAEAWNAKERKPQ